MDIKDLEFITSAKLFTSVFDDEMKSRGFQRKGHLYYRLVGEIMQGVVLKATNPYMICYHAFPIWSLPAIRYPFEPFIENKGYWAEWGMSIWPEYLYGGYYRKERVELNLEVMEHCLQVTKDFFLPILDKVTDIDSYIQYRCLSWEDDGTLKWGNIYRKEFYAEQFLTKYPNVVYKPMYALCYAEPSAIDYHAYLYKAYKDKSFDGAYALLKENISKIPQSWDMLINELLSLFEQKMKEGDLNWIAHYRRERYEQITPVYKKNFKIDMDSLLAEVLAEEIG